MHDETHGREWWDANNRAARIDRESIDRLLAYEDSTKAAHAWAVYQLRQGRPLAEIVPTLRIKYYRAWRRLVGRSA